MVNYEEINKMLDRNSKMPYPQIPNLYQNIRYSKILQESFSGIDGELTTTAQYIYEYINFDDKKELSIVLRRIAIEEMKHLEIVGKIIKRLTKKDIYYIDNNNKEWTAENTKHGISDIKKIMKHNIFLEEKEIIQYRKAIRYTNNMQLRRIFERIIFDENMHKEVFIKILEGID